jgi:hypothetical protein
MSDMSNGSGNPETDKTTIEETMSAIYDKAVSADDTASAPAASLPEGAGLPSAEHEGEPPASSSSPDRLRGPDGKFIEKTKAAVAPKEAAPVETNPAPQTAEPQPTVSAPTSWAADKRALLDKADPALREYIALREKQQIEGVAKLKTEYEGKLGTLAPIAEALRPVEARLKVNNIHPAQYVANLAAADEALRTNPLQAIQEVARMYGIDLGQLQTGAQQAQAYVDPNQAALYQRLGQVETFLQQQQRMQHEAEAAQLNSTIEAFKSDPKNVHFETVRPIMSRLLKAEQATSLQDAYEQAIKLHPEVYAQVTQAQRAAEEETRKQEAARRAAEAKRSASVNVATKGTVGASPSTPKSMEDTIRQVADRIYNSAA